MSDPELAPDILINSMIVIGRNFLTIDVPHYERNNLILPRMERYCIQTQSTNC